MPTPSAEKKARALLRHHLSREQCLDMDNGGEIHGFTETRAGHHYRFAIYDSGGITAQRDNVHLCIACPAGVPQSAQVLALLLCLRADGPGFMATANHMKVWPSPGIRW